LETPKDPEVLYRPIIEACNDTISEIEAA